MVGPTTAAFQIRDFPIVLREEIVRAAKDANMTVADFVAGVCIQARESGWVRTVPTPGATNGGAANGLSNRQDAEIAQNIGILVEAACRLASTKGVAKEVRGTANRTLAKQLAAYSLALPAPKPNAEEATPDAG